MSLVSLAVVAFVGTVFWAASPEAATALVGAQHRASPLLIGIVAAGGQGAALAVRLAPHLVTRGARRPG
jgi:hypothetical protein